MPSEQRAGASPREAVMGTALQPEGTAKAKSWVRGCLSVQEKWFVKGRKNRGSDRR